MNLRSHQLVLTPYITCLWCSVSVIADEAVCLLIPLKQSPLITRLLEKRGSVIRNVLCKKESESIKIYLVILRCVMHEMQCNA